MANQKKYAALDPPPVLLKYYQRNEDAISNSRSGVHLLSLPAAWLNTHCLFRKRLTVGESLCILEDTWLCRDLVRLRRRVQGE